MLCTIGERRTMKAKPGLSRTPLAHLQLPTALSEDASAPAAAMLQLTHAAALADRPRGVPLTATRLQLLGASFMLSRRPRHRRLQLPPAHHSTHCPQPMVQLHRSHHYGPLPWSPYCPPPSPCPPTRRLPAFGPLTFFSSIHATTFARSPSHEKYQLLCP